MGTYEEAELSDDAKEIKLSSHWDGSHGEKNDISPRLFLLPRNRDYRVNPGAPGGQRLHLIRGKWMG